MKWKWFHDLVNNTATWFWKNWQYAGLLLALFVPGIGLAIYLTGIFVRYWGDVKNVINAVIESVKRLFNWFKSLFNLNASKKGGFMGALGNALRLSPVHSLFMQQEKQLVYLELVVSLVVGQLWLVSMVQRLCIYLWEHTSDLFHMLAVYSMHHQQAVDLLQCNLCLNTGYSKKSL